MKERPILMSGPMVRAVLDGRKTQTRRVITPSRYMQHYTKKRHGGFDSLSQANQAAAIAAMSHLAMGSGHFPYGQPGDRLWVRESFRCTGKHESDGFPVYLRADAVGTEDAIHRCGWRPSIHMPRWASRITLEVTAVRVQRVQDITGGDARAEGADLLHCYGPGCDESCNQRGCFGAREWYQELWNSLNEKRGYGWDVNPWVWVIEFRRVDEQRAAA